MLWRWPRPRPTTSPPSRLDAQDGSGDSPEVHEERQQRGTEQETREASPANDEQRGKTETALGQNKCDPGGDGDDAGHMDWQYRFCCGKARQRSRQVVHHHYFEVGTMALIFASSITLIIQSPLDDPSKTKARVLTGIDLSMTFLFSCEMILKVSEREGLRTSTIQKVSTHINWCRGIRGVSQARMHSHHDDGRFGLFVVSKLHVEPVLPT